MPNKENSQDKMAVGTTTQNTPEPPDGRWGWVVTFAAFMVSFFIDGIGFTFGVYLPVFIEYFGGSTAKTSLILSVFVGSYLTFGPIISALVTKLGSRKVAVSGGIVACIGLALCPLSPNLDVMIFLFGFIGGIGYGLLYLPAFIMVSNYFQKRRALATGIACCGSGIGSFAFAPMSVFFLEKFGWKIAVWIIAAMSFVNILLAFVHVPLSSGNSDTSGEANNNNEKSCTKTSSEKKPINRQQSVLSHKEAVNFIKQFISIVKESFDFGLLRSPTFMLYDVSCFLCMFGFFTPFTYLPTIATDIGLDASKGAFLISIIGIANTVGRVAVGFICDQPWANPLIINIVALALAGAATVAVPYFHAYWMLCIYSVVFGTGIAVFISLRSIITVDLIGLSRLTSAFGLVVLAQGSACFLGPPVTGYMFDASGGISLPFYVSGCTLAMSGLICIPLKKISVWEKSRKTKQADPEVADKANYVNHAFEHDSEPDAVNKTISVITKL